MRFKSRERGEELALLLFFPFILKTAVKENENGADTRKHLRILKFLARNPGTVRVSTENSKAKVISRRCAIFRPATAVFRFILTLIFILILHLHLHYKYFQRARHRCSCKIKSIIRMMIKMKTNLPPGFHHIALYSVLQKSEAKSRVLENAIDSRMRIKTTTYSDFQQKPCQFY